MDTCYVDVYSMLLYLFASSNAKLFSGPLPLMAMAYLRYLKETKNDVLLVSSKVCSLMLWCADLPLTDNLLSYGQGLKSGKGNLEQWGRLVCPV